MSTGEQNGSALRLTYHLIIVVALAIAAGRIAVVTSREGDTAFLSANDRSRWCTVASLVEQGTFVIDRQIAITDAKMRNRHPWQTIDKVQHVGSDGKQHYYSSKPPLFPTMVAGVYLFVNLVSGMTLTDQPIYVARIILAIVNLPLLALFFYGTIGSIERTCRSEAAKRFAALSCCFGTMLLPFSISLNNHLPAAAATAVAMWIYVCAATRDGQTGQEGGNKVSFWIWMIAGLAAAFAAANELPALSMTVFWFLLFAVLSRASIVPFVLGATIVAIGFFGTNWMAHQSFRPPYAHRGNGDLIADVSVDSEQPDPELVERIRGALTRDSLITAETPVTIHESDEENRWIVRAQERQFALLKRSGGWQLAHWDDWYEYPGTYWKDGVRQGVDLGEPSRAMYLFQMTIGHHGIFSLTPIWLLVPVGLVVGLAQGPIQLRTLAFAVLVASTVCLLFYLARPEIDRNYGGVSVCFRWMLWFAPLWLLWIAPVAQWSWTSAGGRVLLGSLLAISIFSVSASLQSPWESPWIYQFWRFLGWITV